MKEPTDKERGVIKYLVDKSDRSKTFNWGYWFFLCWKWNAEAENPTWLNMKYQAAWRQMIDIPKVYSPDWFVTYNWRGTPIENTSMTPQLLSRRLEARS